MNQFLKEAVQDYFGKDLEKADECICPGSLVYSFPEEEQLVFIRKGSLKARKTVLSEMLWMDNLNLHTDSVCEPIPSKQNHLTEMIETEQMRYTISMFHGVFTPIEAGQRIEAGHLQLLGELIGKIHAVSRQAGQDGLHYQRKKWSEILAWGSGFLEKKYGAEGMQKIHESVAAINQFPESAEVFGLIYGDFHWQNFYMSQNRLCVFDFDSCQYGFYIHDVASVFRACQKLGYQDEVSFLKEFRQGYEKHMSLPVQEWDKLHTFMELDECFEMLTLATRQ